MTIPATRQISWRALVEEADPDWLNSYLRPVVYRFSNGRKFYSPPNPYSG